MKSYSSTRKFICILILFLITMSCQKDRHVPIISEGNELFTAFDKTKKGSIERDISYLPRWPNRIEFEGSFYIPLDFDK